MDANRLDRVCRDPGFFTVGFDRDLDALIEAAQAVTSVDEATVARLDVATDANFRGYERAGDRLAFEIGRESPDDGRPLAGPNRWPPGWEADHRHRRVLEAHAAWCDSLCRRLTEALASTGNLWAIETDRALVDTIGHLRVWRYPAGEVTLPAHADHGFLSVVVADGPGLQVERVEGSGHFVNAEDLADRSGPVAFVNVGRLLHHVSDRRYRPTIHRVASSSDRPRFSIAYFWAPNDSLPVAPDGATVGQYVAWGYGWQGQVNLGASVAEATDGQIRY